MSVTAGTLTWQALVNAIAEAGTYATLQEAIDAGVVIVGEKAVTGLAVVEGGAAVATTSLTGTALELANASQLSATGAKVSSAGATLLAGETGFKLGGLLTLDVGLVSAVAAPLAGVNLGADLYNANPELWTKISKTLLPFCYDEGKIEAFCDFVVDAESGLMKPVVLIKTAIVDALKQLFTDEGVTTTIQREYTSPAGSVVLGSLPSSFSVGDTTYTITHIGNSASGGLGVVKHVQPDGYCEYYIQTDNGRTLYYISDSIPAGYISYNTGFGAGYYPSKWGLPVTELTDSQIRDILLGPGSTYRDILPTEGVSAPAAPVEPVVWPFPPIIVVPDPVGPDYQPIPVTPVTPLPLPAPEPVPALPEHVPDPTPDKPETWPEEEPWPTIIPWPIQPTEPDPDLPSPDWPDPSKPEVMPWPLPPERPEEWPETPPENWPETPKEWPGEWPEEVPWPESPEDWPEEVPWPDTPPEWWPEGEPWPETPEDWPQEIPWPDTPPEWWPEGEPWPDSPQEWPETFPWPMPPAWPIPWPDDLPYPWPYPYPKPSEDPYPDPQDLPDPDKRVDPYINPWPYEFPDPFPSPQPNPDPTRDPSQPEPKTDTDPAPEPQPQPQSPDPYPTPPTGEPTPPSIPWIPLPFSSTTGLISVYHPTQQELLDFASWLWVTWHDATIDKIWNNPFDGVITLFELYCTPTDVGRKNIRSGFLDSGVSSETISRYTEINCGSIGVPEYYGNYFDYSPYSKCHVFLPFIGIVELNVDDIVGHGVNITYRIDEYNGSCIAMITCAKSTMVNGEEVDYSSIIYQFSGNCAVELPIAGGSQASIKAGLLEAAAWGLGSVISGVITGGVGGGLGIGASIGNNLAQGAASAVHSVVSAKSSVQHSGSFGSSYGAMGGKVPYLIVTRPKQIQVPNYNEHYGYQAHKMVRIGDCDGYIRCREVHVISPTASDEEKALIEQLLKTGVYVTE